ncbi:MAG: sugar phosphate isomerase/epimerase [Ruminococcus sp.]|nr:sugar phosphate isomerase/epimerase [Candidatus Apopatosoma intestinale]
MKLSIMTGGYTHFFIPDLGGVIDYYAGLGYQALDLSLDSKNYDQEFYTDNWKKLANRVQARMNVAHMVFGQAHAPIVAYLDKATEDDAFRLERCIEICGYLHIPSLVVHLLHVRDCTPETFVLENVKYYSRFLPLLDRYNVDFCFENIGNFLEKDCYCGNADELLRVIDAMNHPHIHACWDTGHANLYNLDQYPNLIKLGDHLRAVHIHDNHYPITTPDGEFTPDAHNFPLFGNINFDAFIQGLIDIGYKGTFSIETDTPNRRGHRDFIYNGVPQVNLKPIPFRIRRMADEMLAEIGKYMLETYGLLEK